LISKEIQRQVLSNAAQIAAPKTSLRIIRKGLVHKPLDGGDSHSPAGSRGNRVGLPMEAKEKIYPSSQRRFFVQKPPLCGTTILLLEKGLKPVN